MSSLPDTQARVALSDWEKEGRMNAFTKRLEIHPNGMPIFLF